MNHFAISGLFLFLLLVAYGCGIASLTLTLIDELPKVTVILSLSCAATTQFLMRYFSR